MAHMSGIDATEMQRPSFWTTPGAVTSRGVQSWARISLLEAMLFVLQLEFQFFLLVELEKLHLGISIRLDSVDLSME